MDTRRIITLIIIIAAIAGAGVFAYMSFSGDSGAVPAQQAVSTTNPILPHGNNLDFGVVNEYNETGRQFQYPVVTPAETGLTLNEIIEQ